MSERELREQLKVTKRMLEMQHGRALKHGEPREAEAYYDAIKDLDTALVKNWRTDGTADELFQEWVRLSQQARQAGWKEATKYEQRQEEWREKHRSTQNFWQALLGKIGLR